MIALHVCPRQILGLLPGDQAPGEIPKTVPHFSLPQTHGDDGTANYLPVASDVAQHILRKLLHAVSRGFIDLLVMRVVFIGTGGVGGQLIRYRQQVWLCRIGVQEDGARPNGDLFNIPWPTQPSGLYIPTASTAAAEFVALLAQVLLVFI